MANKWEKSKTWDDNKKTKEKMYFVTLNLIDKLKCVKAHR